MKERVLIMLFLACYILPPIFCQTNGGYDIAWYNCPVSVHNFKISNAEEWAGLSHLVNVDGKTFRGDTIHITADIKVNDTFETLSVFEGVIFGNGHQLTNVKKMLFQKLNGYVEGLLTYGNVSTLSVYAKELNGTLINCINYASIDVSFGDYPYVGSFCSKNNGLLAGCRNYASVTCRAQQLPRCGGLVGSMSTKGTIIACTNEGNVTSSSATEAALTGGILGDEAGTILFCLNKGIVTASAMSDTQYPHAYSTGGIVGRIQSGALIDACINEGNVKCYGFQIGGICGEAGNVTIVNCINSGTVSGNGRSYSNIFAGGIVGWMEAKPEYGICNVMNKGNVTATASGAFATSGGIIGVDKSDIRMNNWYSSVCSSSSASGAGSHKFSGCLSSGIDENPKKGLYTPKSGTFGQICNWEDSLAGIYNQAHIDEYPQWASWSAEEGGLSQNLYVYPVIIQAGYVKLASYHRGIPAGEKKDNSILLKELTSDAEYTYKSADSICIIGNLNPDTRYHYIWKEKVADKQYEYRGTFLTLSAHLTTTVSNIGCSTAKVETDINAEGISLKGKGYRLKASDGSLDKVYAIEVDEPMNTIFTDLSPATDYLVKSFIVINKTDTIDEESIQFTTKALNATVKKVERHCIMARIWGDYTYYEDVKAKAVFRLIPFNGGTPLEVACNNDSCYAEIARLDMEKGYDVCLIIKSSRKDSLVSSTVSMESQFINTDIQVKPGDDRLLLEFKKSNLLSEQYLSHGVRLKEWKSEEGVNSYTGVFNSNDSLCIDKLAFLKSYEILPFYEAVLGDTVWDNSWSGKAFQILDNKDLYPVFKVKEIHCCSAVIEVLNGDKLNKSPLTYTYKVKSDDLLICNEQNCFTVEGLIPSGTYRIAFVYNGPYDNPKVFYTETNVKTLSSEVITLPYDSITNTFVRLKGLVINLKGSSNLFEYRKLTDGASILSQKVDAQRIGNTCYAVIPHEGDGTIWQYRINSQYNGSLYGDWQTFTASSSKTGDILPECLTDTVTFERGKVTSHGHVVKGSEKLEDLGFELAVVDVGEATETSMYGYTDYSYTFTTLVHGYSYRYRTYARTASGKCYGPWVHFNAEGENLPNGIVSNTQDTANVYGLTEAVRIVTSIPQQALIYTISGSLCMQKQLYPGELVIRLPKGIYIVYLQDKSYKVVVQ